MTHSANSNEIREPSIQLDCEKVILLGDSLTQSGYEKNGWVSLLCARYVRRADIINRGFSGYNSKWGLSLLKELELPKRPILVVVFFGANDSALKELNAHQHVPIEEYRENICSIVKYLQNHLGARHIVLLSPPPLIEQTWRDHRRAKSGDKTAESDRNNDTTCQYAHAVNELAKELNIPSLDLFTLFSRANARESLFDDGLHFSKEGHKLLFDALIKLIEKYIPSCTVVPEPAQKKINSSSKSQIVQLGPWFDQISDNSFTKTSLTRS